jgi:hypothetical protein
MSNLSRREMLRLTTAGLVGFSMSGWLKSLADDSAKDPQRKRSCILLWMNGGPSQMDTFDLKPGTTYGGEFKEIQTSAPGLKISEHLPKIAKFGDRMAVIRSMSTKEADHGRATFYLRTGYLQTGSVQFPTLGSLMSKELGSTDAPLPNFVSIAPYRFFNPASYGSGFLGPQYAPLIVGDGVIPQPNQTQTNYEQSLRVQDLDLPHEITSSQAEARVGLLEEMDREFSARRPGVSPQSHATAYQRAIKLMRSEGAKVFNLEEEKESVRDAYGRNLFGQGCLLARRLVERGVPFVEVSLTGAPGLTSFGWDTHNDNFANVKRLSEVLDPAWATLMSDLKDRGLLDSTLIVWMGEFGRTPTPQGNGRDHWATAWSTVLAGGGIKGGQAYGKTSDDGMEVTENPVSVPDLLATVAVALGLDPMKQNASNVGRPIRIADPSAKPIKEVVA